jgi:predicted regulator of amino acid metabolism with ACT domain
MATLSPGGRIDRLEHVVQIIAEDQISLQKLVSELATQFRETGARLETLGKETDARIATLATESAERARVLDERIDRIAQEGARTREVFRRARRSPGDCHR